MLSFLRLGLPWKHSKIEFVPHIIMGRDKHILMLRLHNTQIQCHMHLLSNLEHENGKETRRRRRRREGEEKEEGKEGEEDK